MTKHFTNRYSLQCAFHSISRMYQRTRAQSLLTQQLVSQCDNNGKLFLTFRGRIVGRKKKEENPEGPPLINVASYTHVNAANASGGIRAVSRQI